MIARSILLRPGGPLACELARHAVVLKVNDWVFCHGGLIPNHGKKSAYNLNKFGFLVSLAVESFREEALYISCLHHLIGVLVLPQLHMA